VKRSHGIVRTVALLGFTVFLVVQAFAHPAVHGGIRSAGGLALAQGVMAIVPEIVADRKAGQVRVYIVEETIDKVDGKPQDMVRNLTVRSETVGKGDAIVLPLPTHPKNEAWFSVQPVTVANGFVYYRIELTMRVSLDGKPGTDLTFGAGADARGFHCLIAPLEMGGAQNVRIESATFTVYDASKKASWSKKLYEKAGGSGFGSVTYGTDLSLAKFEETIAKSADLDKFRKPQAPELTAKK